MLTLIRNRNEAFSVGANAAGNNTVSAAAATGRLEPTSDPESLATLTFVIQPHTAYPPQNAATPSRDAAASDIMLSADEAMVCWRRLE